MEQAGICQISTVEAVMNVIGGKWTFPILCNLLRGDSRFTEIQHHLDGISPKMLSRRLLELTENGIITRNVIPELPPRVEYRLTAKGKDLRPLFQAIGTWGTTWNITETSTAQ
ncbi:winged helix-turn-helix transcriptional regulator [Bifidobacterium aquikefiricola]|uniref:Helix-turn-helix domain-containing protein n=1 Tax=Bifidobacterium aquikefiricola TaxID=3059038 RepID=A0AB39U687_9BIFI